MSLAHVSTPAPAQPQLEISGSRNFTSWLREERLSLAFSTYQTGKLFLIGVKPDGRLSVFERTRELGILRALGMRPLRLVSLILIESVFLAGVAATIGLVIGLALDAWLAIDGIDLSGSLEGGYEFAGVVIDPVIKGVIRATPIVQIVVAVFGVTLLASLWPAYRAARLRPVEAIRAE